MAATFSESATIKPNKYVCYNNIQCLLLFSRHWPDDPLKIHQLLNGSLLGTNKALPYYSNLLPRFHISPWLSLLSLSKCDFPVWHVFTVKLIHFRCSVWIYAKMSLGFITILFINHNVPFSTFVLLILARYLAIAYQVELIIHSLKIVYVATRSVISSIQLSQFCIAKARQWAYFTEWQQLWECEILK